MIKSITREEPVLWRSGLIGFGKAYYKYESRREGYRFYTDFSQHAHNLALYIIPNFKKYDALMQNLEKYKAGKSCLHIKKLSAVNMGVLKELITLSTEHAKILYNH